MQKSWRRMKIGLGLILVTDLKQGTKISSLSMKIFCAIFCCILTYLKSQEMDLFIYFYSGLYRSLRDLKTGSCFGRGKDS